MSTTSNSSRPSTGSQHKDPTNPLIRQDFELTEELTKYVEAGYGSCGMDMQGNVKAHEVREVLIKLWVEQDQLEQHEDQDQAEKDREQGKEQGKDQGKDQGRTSRANSRAASRAGSQKQQKDGQGQDQEDEHLKAIQTEVDVIMRQIEEAICGINQVDNTMNKAQVDLTKEQFIEAAGSMFWVRCAQVVLSQLFKVFDDDGDGYIEAKDLSRVMDEVDNPLKPDEVRGMMDTSDHDGDGKITFDEFKEAMLKQY